MPTLNAFQEAQNIVGRLKRQATGLVSQLGAGIGQVGQQIFPAPPPPELISPLIPTPTPTPTPDYSWKPLPSGGRYRVEPPTPTQTVTPTPMATPTPIPWNIKEIAYEQRPYHKDISGVWGKEVNTAHDILRYVSKTGEVKGENVSYQVGPKMDIPNRINPETGQWDTNAPIKTFINPFTGQQEQSIDRGLFRINNGTFYDFQRRFPNWLKGHEITSWDDMLDVRKNIIMAKFIFDIQKKAWYAAKSSTGARIE